MPDVQVYDWQQLSQFLTRVKCSHLDMRKMVFVKEREATWADILGVALPNVVHIQLPRIPGPTLAAFFENVPQLQVVNSPLVTNALDTAALARLGHLTDLRLKAGSGCLQLDGGLKPLEGLAGTLTKLSLLTVTGLTDTDYDVLGTLSNLEQGHNQFTKRVSLSNTNLNCIFGGDESEIRQCRRTVIKIKE